MLKPLRVLQIGSLMQSTFLLGKYILHNSPKADMVWSDLGVVYFSAAVLYHFFFCFQGQPKLHNSKLKSFIVS